ncbi:unnamed protein product, partial [Allacma fusca]
NFSGFNYSKHLCKIAEIPSKSVEILKTNPKFLELL